MASAELSENVVDCSEEIIRLRPEPNFPPSLWGDQFIDFSPDALLAENYAKGIDGLKGEVKHMLSICESSMVETLKLIDTLERLGISYHFHKEIELKLAQFYKLDGNYENESYDLQTVALHFRLFRQHGYHISCDTFRKFMDRNDKFQNGLKGDARGLLSLYDAAHLRIRGEIILEDGILFATANLKAMAPHLESCLRKQVDHALMQPLHFGVARIEILKFISLYEEDESKNSSLLKFAKLDYNLLQILHRQELSELSRWWKELDLLSKLPYARDRLVECYLWAISAYYEPQHSRARIILTKTIIIVSVIDDTYDSYGTITELEIFTNIFQRWDIQEMDHLPVYMRPLYKTILELYEQFNEELADEGRSHVLCYAIEELKELVRSYYVEAKWFNEGCSPKFSEYLANGLVTCTNYYHATTSLLGMESVSIEAFEWLSKRPKIAVASSLKCRTFDDVSTYKGEKERGQQVTGIDIYMKENGVNLEKAIEEFMEMHINGWKDTNEECLKPSYDYPRDVVMRNILNLDRSVEVAYKNKQDGYTNPEKVLKPIILAICVTPLKIE